MKMWLLVSVFSGLLFGCEDGRSGSVLEHRTPKDSIPFSVVQREGGRMNGLNFVAPPKPIDSSVMLAVKGVNANWIAVIPYAFTPGGEAMVKYSFKGNWKWWGETPEGVSETIIAAHRRGIAVMVKPQVFMHGGFTGNMSFSKESDWAQWERQYEDYILPFASLADSLHAEMFCVGTEFEKSVLQRGAFWRSLIGKVKARYKGKVTYAANWDEYEKVPFWDMIDYVGINAYFSLSQSATPTVEELTTAWQPLLKQIRGFQKRVGKPIVFTEFGYMSVDGCAYRNWELEKDLGSKTINEVAQANALEALLGVFYQESYWKGGFVWKWYPGMQGHEGYPGKDYTPQGKKGEGVIKGWYGKK